MRSTVATRSLDSTSTRASGNSARTSSSSRSTPGPQATKDSPALAFRALRRMRHGEAAMVADELLAEAVIDQPGVAVRAGEAEAAGAAQRQRRVAAAVEKQQRLLAALERDLDRFGKRGAMKRPRGGRSLAQIDRLDRRQQLAAEPLRQREPPVAAAPRVDLGLERRRRRRQHHRDPGDVAAHHRHVAGVIVHAVFLLVGGVVLLIDDDQAEIGIGQEQRRARADHDRDLAVGHRRARCAARLRGASSECHSAGRTPKRAAKRSRNCAVSAISGIRIRLCRPRADRVGHRLEIDLGLARAGDAVDQRRPNSRRRRRSLAAPRRGCAWRRRSPAPRNRDRASRRDRFGRQRRRFPACLRRSGRRSTPALDAGLLRPPRSCRATMPSASSAQHAVRAPRSCAAAAGRRGARRRARARGRDARPCAGTCAAPCRAG